MHQNSSHWNRIFEKTEAHRLGWYEADPAPIFDLLGQVEGWERAFVFLPGAGTSVLVDRLLLAGSTLILNDLSFQALEQLKKRLGTDAGKIEWICQDIAQPLDITIPKVDLWIDRAVLHFLTDADDIDGYFRNVAAKLKVGGHALFAEFPPHGAAKCAGMELHRYSLEELSERLGSDFALADHFEHTYTNPAGDPRPYIYSLFKRIV